MNFESLVCVMHQQCLRGRWSSTKRLPLEDLFCILDDIIVKLTLRILVNVYQRIKNAHLKFSPKKCNLFEKEVKPLGHVSSSQVSTDPENEAVVKEWPVPKK